jgi:HD-GYP domain-containing protein (c-di-GMP phosphodiesterase class II)
MIFMSLDDARPGMVLGVGLHNREGQTLLGAGVTLTDAYIERLRALGCTAVWIDDEDTRDIQYEHLLSEDTRLAASAEIRNTFALVAREVPALRAASIREIRNALETRRFQRGFDADSALERLLDQAGAIVSEVLDRAVLTGLGSIRSHDTYTFHHCLDVAATAAVIGRLLGYDQDTLKKLAVGCMLHDIGKIFIEDAILAKTTPLSPDEWLRVREHTVLGYLVIRDSLHLGVLAAHVAYQHHERQDGRGYPRGLTGTNRVLHGLEIHVPGQITPLAEIAALADFYDSRSSDRPYRRAFAPDQVWHMIRDGAGTRFNQEMADLFLSVLPLFPVGTRVVVTSGRWQGCTGVVARVSVHSIAQPMVRILADADGRRVSPVDLDLRTDDATISGLAGPGYPIAPSDGRAHQSGRR